MAKLCLLKASDRFCQESSEPKSRALEIFVSKYLSGEISIPDWVRRQRPQLCSRTLLRWKQLIKEDAVNALYGKYGHRKGQNLIDTDPELQELVMAHLATNYCGAVQLWRTAQARFGDAIPNQRTFQRWLETWKQDNKALDAYLRNPKEYRSKHKPALGSRSERVTALNDLWEIDSTISDCIWELGDGKRYALIACIDVYSRRVKILVSPTSNSDAIAALLRRCLLEWGVPKAVRTDNGKDYTSKYLDMVFQSLAIEHELCRPFTPEEKPHVERVIGTFNHSLLELLPGYTGPSVVVRQQIREREAANPTQDSRGMRVLSVEKSMREFQEFCDQWAIWYAQSEHTGLPKIQDGSSKRHMTPQERAAAQSRKVLDERLLDVLLLKAPEREGMRTIGKKGLRLGTLHEGTAAWYIADWMGEPENSNRVVHVRLDPIDLGRLYVFSDSDCREFVGIAECPELTGIDRREIAAKAQQEAKQVKRIARNYKDTAKVLQVTHDPHQILDLAVKRASNVIQLPGGTTPHVSAGLESAADAIGEIAARTEGWRTVRELPPDLAEYHAQQVAEREAAQAKMETDSERFMRLQADYSMDQYVPPKDWTWMTEWIATPEGREFFPNLWEPAQDAFRQFLVLDDQSAAAS
jgi:hypothetical protein